MKRRNTAGGWRYCMRNREGEMREGDEADAGPWQARWTLDLLLLLLRMLSCLFA